MLDVGMKMAAEVGDSKCAAQSRRSDVEGGHIHRAYIAQNLLTSMMVLLLMALLLFEAVPCGTNLLSIPSHSCIFENRNIFDLASLRHRKVTGKYFST